MRGIADRKSTPPDPWLSELEEALDGSASGPAAEYWRELRTDVRSLAPPLDPGFARELERKLAERGAAREQARKRARIPAFIRGAGPRSLSLGLGGSAAAVLAVIAALLVIGPWRSTPSGGAHHGPTPAHSGAAGSASGPSPAAGAQGPEFGPVERVPRASAGPEEGPETSGEEAATEGEAPLSAAASPIAPAPEAASPPVAGVEGKRLERLEASIGLTTSPGQVQGVSDRIERLARSEGGYVESSEVHVQGAGRDEASLLLKVPSGKLETTMASLERLAKVSSENDSSEDITGSYNSALARLKDDRVEHEALVRALAAADHEREIASLQRRLARSRRAIERASAQVQGISHQASRASIEVTVTGHQQKKHTGTTGARGGGHHGLTLGSGARKALHVLTVVVVVLLVAAAILLPLTLLALILLGGYGAFRRRRREQALDAA